MPFLKRRTSFRRRTSSGRKRTVKPVRRFRRTYRKKSRKPIINGIFPPRLPVKLTYAEYDLAITGATVGTPGTYVFRLNSLYDPNATGVGHSCKLFDTLCGNVDTDAPYFRYTVYGAKVTITFKNATAKGSVWICGTNQAGPTNNYDARENPNATVKLIDATSSNTNRGTVTIRRYYSIAKIWGKTNRYITDYDGNSANYNQNPGIASSLFVQYEPEYASVGGKDVYFNVRIDYYAVLSMRNEQRTS